MLIDWFTVFAQIINFLILVWLLKRFLYRPILSAIEKREDFVKAQLDLAASKLIEVQERRDLLEAEKASFEENKKIEMTKVIDEAQLLKVSLIEDAKEDMEALSQRQIIRLNEEEDTFKKDLIRKTQNEVFVIARKALSDLASENLEAQMVNKLIGKIDLLGSAEREAVIHGLKSTNRPLLIRSTSELSMTQKNEISKALIGFLKDEVSIDFDIDSKLICGIEIVTNGYKLDWNIDEYLKSVSKVTSVLSSKKSNLKDRGEADG